jgi:ribonuclease BN (tRNA processing enzyme)
MKIKILGGHGGQSQGFSTTSFLINDELLIDAGSITSALSIDQQNKIDHILISHAHLDHIKDLAFICDNCFGLRPSPFKVYTHPTVKKILKDHLFNELVWPDFTVLPTPSSPILEIVPILPEVTFKVKDYEITPYKVQHPNDAMGFIIEHKNKSVLFTMDSAATERIWEAACERSNLVAIFTEVSFPNSLQAVAQASDHHTPESLKSEMDKMPANIPIILTHLKPNYRDLIMEELRELRVKRIRVLENDGEIFEF